MDERIPTNYTVRECSYAHISLVSTSDDATFTLQPFRDNTFRVTFTAVNRPLPSHPSIPTPEILFSRTPELKEHNSAFVIGTSAGVTITLTPNPTPVLCIDLNNVQLYSDLPNRSYVLDRYGSSRYGFYDPKVLHLGLGERAGPFDLSNRTFSLSALDAAGYDAHRTDPLYKHIPLLIRATPIGCVGIFSTSHSRGTWSVGGEIDALWGSYEVMRQDYGGLELYFIVSHSLQNMVKSFADLAGYPRMIPRWALGYLASSMGYAESDHPPAQTLLENFPALCKKYDIPCSAMHLSSGYTVSMIPPHTRNVFTLNTHRFPDPSRLFKRLSDAGIRTIANVKPYLLATHPEYQALAENGAFFETPDEKVATSRLWSEGLGENRLGSWLDMTSPAAQQWWYQGLRVLLDWGIVGIWNDNNEFGLTSDRYRCTGKNGSGTKKLTEIGAFGRLVNTEIMAKISLRAITDTLPGRRPLLLTRSATAGTMQYANSSWSGDNYSSWNTMPGNNAMGLAAGLCLLQSYGHDCGGFAGPTPSAQLLLRWVQLATLQPRFTIHSWKPTNEDPSSASNITEPWTYPSILPQVREAIKRRYELIPYLYELCFQSALDAQPLQRWVGWGPYSRDPVIWNHKVLRDGEGQFWLGDAFIVGGVYEDDSTETTIYLPSCGPSKMEHGFGPITYYDDGFISIHAPHQYYLPGRWVTVSTPLSNIAVLARVGAVVPVGRRCVTTASPKLEPNLEVDDWRGVEIFPPPVSSLITGREYVGCWREDDGISDHSAVSHFKVFYQPNGDNIYVRAECVASKFEVAWKWKFWIILPIGERRPVFVDGLGDSRVSPQQDIDTKGRHLYQVQVSV